MIKGDFMKHAIIMFKGKPYLTGEIKDQTPEVYLKIKKEAEKNLQMILEDFDDLLIRIEALEEENKNLKIRLDRLEGRE